MGTTRDESVVVVVEIEVAVLVLMLTLVDTVVTVVVGPAGGALACVDEGCPRTRDSSMRRSVRALAIVRS